MNPRRALAWGVIGGVVLLGGGWWTYENRVASPRRALLEESVRLRDGIERANATALERAREVKKLDAIAERTLGDDTESVVHELRVRLTALGESVGLRGISVGTRAAGGARNPAAGSSGATELRAREFRERADYFVVRASFEGTGSLGEVLWMLDAVRQQGVAWRVGSISLSPTRDRGALVLGFEVETLFLADRPSGGGGGGVASVARSAIVDKLSARSFFTAPVVAKPVEVVEAREPVRVEPPKPDPRGEQRGWMVTGIVAGASGDELWVVRSDSGERRVLRPGEELSGVRLGRIEDGVALVECVDGRYWLVVGDTLANRDRPVGGQ